MSTLIIIWCILSLINLTFCKIHEAEIIKEVKNQNGDFFTDDFLCLTLYSSVVILAPIFFFLYLIPSYF